jgi:hypothetical protein
VIFGMKNIPSGNSDEASKRSAVENPNEMSNVSMIAPFV